MVSVIASGISSAGTVMLVSSGADPELLALVVLAEELLHAVAAAAATITVMNRASL
jgi:L-lactate utilization protein LutC